jgi:pilus assembly protein Flp/PilA
MAARGACHEASTEIEMKTLVSRFAKDESGATAIEYGLIAAGLAVAIVVTVNAVGSQLHTLFGDVKSKLGGE